MRIFQEWQPWRARRGRVLLAAVLVCGWGLNTGAASGRVAFETVRLTNGPLATLCLLQPAGQQATRRPVILTLGSLKENEPPDWSTNLLQEGFMLVAFAVEYPPDPDSARRPVWLHFDPRFAHSYVLGGIRTPRDASRVIDYLVTRPDVDAERIGWLGSSTTGIFGLAAATHEPRIKALVAFVATGAYEKWLATWKPNGLWQGTETDLWPETVSLLPEADPIRRATNLFPCATLLINGGADKVVDVASTRAFVEAARPAFRDDPDRLRLVVYDGMGHNLPRDVLRLYAEHWFRMYLGGSGAEAAAKSRPASLAESTRKTALTATPHELLVGAAPLGAKPGVRVESWQAFMPRPEDYTLRWWADGPPSYLGSVQSPASETLCLQSGKWGMAFDTKRVRLVRLGAFARATPSKAAMESGRDESLNELPPATWDCAVIVGGHRFECVGHKKQRDEFFQPVQVIESGRFFQRVVIADLEFADEAGQLFLGSARLEISAWPDRLAFRLEVEPKETSSDGRIEWSVGTMQASARIEPKTRLSLVVVGSDVRGTETIEAESPLRVDDADELGCHTVALPEQTWSNAKGTYYPEEHLDRLDRWRLTLHNDSDQESTARLMFTQENSLPITGFTPLLTDPDGAPIGLPVQISKNWHQRPEKGALPHQGPWFHGCTFVHLPPHTRREFTFSMVYARYGGVFAASHAQLCLVGWGHNQFWDQAAIGSFGESICFEPGRVQRRCFVDDIRPLLTLPEAPGAKPYGWAGNCGGGDFLMWKDTQGQYRPFRATRTDYRAYGPCRTEVTYADETCGGELAEQVTVSIARSEDYLRTFFRLRYQVRKPIRWQRLAFFQLGADFYNDTPSRRVAIGDTEGVREEWEPRRAKNEFDRRGEPLSGLAPWVSIHGLESGVLKPGTAAASRGLIIRHWKAVLDGKPAPVPYLSSWCTEWGKDNNRTTLELGPPSGVAELQGGDYVEAELELVVFPARAAAYYGPDTAFRAVLAQNADSWQLVQREAAGNALQLKPLRGELVRSYPLEMAVDDASQTAEITVAGGLGYVPVTFTGLAQPKGYSVWLDERRVDQSVHGNDFWQTDYDPVQRRWQITYNLPLNRSGLGRQKLRFAPAPAASLGE